jgi:hypothetical protein
MPRPKRWREHGDHEAAHKLVNSHLRLVAKIATGYRGYGLPISDVISEGNVGLMRAIQRFEPEKGFRLAKLAGGVAVSHANPVRQAAVDRGLHEIWRQEGTRTPLGIGIIAAPSSPRPRSQPTASPHRPVR